MPISVLKEKAEASKVGCGGGCLQFNEIKWQQQQLRKVQRKYWKIVKSMLVKKSKKVRKNENFKSLNLILL